MDRNFADEDEAYRQAEVNKAKWREKYPDAGDQFLEPNSHPFVQVGPFIKVALYNQWHEDDDLRHRTWADARIGTIYGLRFGKRGFGLTFHKGT